MFDEKKSKSSSTEGTRSTNDESTFTDGDTYVSKSYRDKGDVEATSEFQSESEGDGSESSASTIVDGPCCYQVFGCGTSFIQPYHEIQIATAELSTDIWQVHSSVSVDSSTGSENSISQMDLSGKEDGMNSKEKSNFQSSLDGRDSYDSSSSDLNQHPWWYQSKREKRVGSKRVSHFLARKTKRWAATIENRIELIKRNTLK